MPQLTFRQQELIQKGIREGLLKLDGDKIEYVVQRKSYIFTDPEEPVRAATYVEFVKRFEYPPERIDFEQEAPARHPPLPADIVIYLEDTHEHAYAVAECKATSSSADIKEGQKQGLGNANLLLAQYLVIAAGDEVATYDVRSRPSVKGLEKCRIAELPVGYRQPPKFKYKKGAPEFVQLRRVDLKELHRKLQRCHDVIWEGGKRDPAEAFDEMSKLMFAKIYDERFTEVGKFYDFQVGTGEDEINVASRVTRLYSEAAAKEPAVFRQLIKVPGEIIFDVVGILQDISLTETDLDSKGRAFEKFLGKVFRGELGQFFTPREVIDFMVKFVDPSWRDVIMDPACGSSGFLLYAIEHVANKAREKFLSHDDAVKRVVWDFSHDNVFGIEINDRIARIAMMDMVIHDDGHTNIEPNDALLDYSHFDPRRDIRPNKYDLILTNPPFGAIEKRREVLDQFILGRRHKAQKKEFLFIERCLELLKSNRMMGIVLPDGVLNNPTWDYVRAYIKDKAHIIAVVSLPEETFIPFGSYQKASILFLRKRQSDTEDAQPKYVFMAKLGAIGFDSTGKPTTVNDCPTTLARYELFRNGQLRMEQVYPLRLSEVTEAFPVEEREKGFLIEFEELQKEGRWDVEHFRPKIKALLATLRQLRCPKLEELASVYCDEVNIAGLEGKIVTYIEKISGETGELAYVEAPHDLVPRGATRSFRANTIVVSRINAKIKCFAIVPQQLDGILGTNEYYGLVPKANVTIEYLAKILRSEIVRQQIVAKTNGLYKRLKREEAEELLVPLPSPELQVAVKRAKDEATKLRGRAEAIENEALRNVLAHIERGGNSRQ